MQFSISGAGSQTQTIKDADVGAIAVNIVATDTTGATITTAILQGIKIVVTLTRNGMPFTIMSGNLLALGQASYPSSMEGVAINSTTGNKAFMLEFGEVINLNGNDVLQVELSVTTAAAGQVLTLDTIQRSGIGAYIPKVVQYTIDTNQSNQSIGGGDFVGTISIVSDNATVLDLTSINVVTNGRYQQNATTATFFAFIASQWERVPEFLSFQLYNGELLHGVQINTTNAATAANTWVVVYGGVADVTTIKRAENMANKQMADTQQQFAKSAM